MVSLAEIGTQRERERDSIIIGETESRRINGSVNGIILGIVFARRYTRVTLTREAEPTDTPTSGQRATGVYNVIRSLYSFSSPAISRPRPKRIGTRPRERRRKKQEKRRRSVARANISVIGLERREAST